MDKILGPAGGNTPTAMGDRLCQYQQSGNELRITVSEAASYDDAVETHGLNVGTGPEIGPEAVPGVGEKAVVFYGVGRPIAALRATQGGTMVEFDWFDAASGSEKADIARILDLARSVLAGT